MLGSSLYNVMTAGNREKLINIKIAEDVRHQIHVVAELRGLKMSQVIHSYVIQAIREERDKNPSLFDEMVKRRQQQAGAATPRPTDPERNNNNGAGASGQPDRSRRS